MATKIGKIKVEEMGPHLLKLSPPWYADTQTCTKALPELQKTYKVTSAFITGGRLYVITQD